ncbi:hypothetical protein GQR58_017555 [Nymphon striatum]|nr:hypothetical protein GQR58_017555 [Nymphon striatum]
MGNLPCNLKLERLDDGQGLATTLSDHSVKWHKNCRYIYNQTKLKHLQNRKRKDSSASTSSESSSTHSRAQYTATQTTGSIAPIPLTTNNDSDAMCLARAAQIIRIRIICALYTDMFQELFSFEGSFSSKCQEKSLSLVLIAMIAQLTRSYYNGAFIPKYFNLCLCNNVEKIGECTTQYGKKDPSHTEIEYANNILSPLFAHAEQNVWDGVPQTHA